jgi:hypothetical protein
MTVSVVGFYRGGTIEDVAPLAMRMKAILLRHGVDYQVNRFLTGENVGDWLVIVRYADWMAYAKAQTSIATDVEHRQLVTEISKAVTLVRRELVEDLAL